MTWRGWHTARRLLAEEFIWAPRRAMEAQQVAEEDRAFESAMSTARP